MDRAVIFVSSVQNELRVERRAVYVGLFGDEYGSTAADGPSPTEREFHTATAAAKPRLISMKGAAGTPRLIWTASAKLIRRRFASTTGLTRCLYASLVEHLARDGSLRTHPHASIPRNALTCEPLFLVHYIEKAGTGTLDMIAQCREAGLPEPEFREKGGSSC